MGQMGQMGNFSSSEALPIKQSVTYHPHQAKRYPSPPSSEALPIFPIKQSVTYHPIKRSVTYHPHQAKRYPSPPSSEALPITPIKRSVTHYPYQQDNSLAAVDDGLSVLFTSAAHLISEINLLLETTRYNARRISRRWAVPKRTAHC